jgi:hypothetical protein
MLVLANASERVLAGTLPGNLNQWAYAAYFGTGWYQAGGNQDVFVLQFAPRWESREPGIDADGRRNLGIEFRLPVSFGLHQFSVDALPAIFDVDNFASASIVPGLEVEIPVSERWSLKPLAYLGWGSEIAGPQSAWIYWAGLKSRYRMSNGGLDWSIVNALKYLGYSPSDGPSSSAVPVMAGLEFQWPMQGGQLHGRPVYLDGHATYTAYLDDLEFNLDGIVKTPIADEWELGLAVSQGKPGLTIWRLNLDRIGLAYRFSSSGDFRGVSLIFNSVFDR